ncbi:glutathione S-transferase family protein [Paucibacter sp. PLA-PC-4]|uniref:glutathione S-transferase family protein n=1 Tax=Paucibacter sp. PLA-PC-4 TaxID=2993655 RepID=UPI0022497C0C|nr:glutathione S-transferase family protein [Paucibacter sp. PLA-PC-4]MCX2860752.1 glutathione S-transferase family protein [Paucibacter sp. PLA-PC-4]
MHLIIGNKNYSSWSMRPWVLLRAFGIPFEERKLRFDFAPGSDFYRELGRHTPTGKVPVLVEDDGFAVWDTLAIAEHIAERHPDLPIWPRDARQRSRARSLCAEMHAGFGALRQNCPMNIEANLSEIGARVLAEQPQVRADLARIDAIWSEQLAASSGPFLFGEFGAIDAYFAPVVMRIHSYGLPLSPASAAYAQRVRQAPGVADWITDSLAEQDFLDFEEPYRKART